MCVRECVRESVLNCYIIKFHAVWKKKKGEKYNIHQTINLPTFHWDSDNEEKYISKEAFIHFTKYVICIHINTLLQNNDVRKPRLLFSLKIAYVSAVSKNILMSLKIIISTVVSYGHTIIINKLPVHLTNLTKSLRYFYRSHLPLLTVTHHPSLR